jgi:hypothetical protein
MVILSKMVEISFSDKSPDRLSTEERSGKSTFWPASWDPAILSISDKTPFSGQHSDLIPNILW